MRVLKVRLNYRWIVGAFREAHRLYYEHAGTRARVQEVDGADGGCTQIIAIY